MKQPKAYEFRNMDELIRHLSKNKAKLGKWFSTRTSSLDSIVHGAVAGNTFRAFRNMPQRPSEVFRKWASNEFENVKTINELK